MAPASFAAAALLLVPAIIAGTSARAQTTNLHRPAHAARTADRATGHWWNPPANPKTVGIVGSTGDMSFIVFYASCDPAGRTVWLTRTSMKRSPREHVLNFIIDGKPYGVMANPGDDDETGGHFLNGDTYYGAPVVTALLNAKAVRIVTDGVPLDLPVAGMSAAMASFRRTCHL